MKYIINLSFSNDIIILGLNQKSYHLCKYFKNFQFCIEFFYSIDFIRIHILRINHSKINNCHSLPLNKYFTFSKYSYFSVNLF